MNLCFQLESFLRVAERDENLNNSSTCLYLSLLFEFARSNRESVQISRKRMMKSAKIGSIATYHKSISYLHALGYICYTPSYNPKTGSKLSIPSFFGPVQSFTTGLKSEQVKRTEPVQILASSSESERVEGVQPVQILASSSESERVEGVQPVQILVSSSKSERVEVQKMNGFKNQTSAEKPVNKGMKRSSSKNEQLPLEHNIYSNSLSITIKKEEIKNPSSGAEGTSVSRSPKIEQVKEYFIQNQSSSFEAERFFTYYTQQNWKNKEGKPISNWVFAAKYWIERSLAPHNASLLNTQVETNKRYDIPL